MKKESVAGSKSPKGSGRTYVNPDGTPCKELAKELMECIEVRLPLETLGKMFLGTIIPYVKEVEIIKTEWDSLKEVVVLQNDRIKQLEKDMAGMLTEETTKRRAAAARKR